MLYVIGIFVIQHWNRLMDHECWINGHSSLNYIVLFVNNYLLIKTIIICVLKIQLIISPCAYITNVHLSYYIDYVILLYYIYHSKVPSMSMYLHIDMYSKIYLIVLYVRTPIPTIILFSTIEKLLLDIPILLTMNLYIGRVLVIVLFDRSFILSNHGSIKLVKIVKKSNVSIMMFSELYLLCYCMAMLFLERVKVIFITEFFSRRTALKKLICFIFLRLT